MFLILLNLFLELDLSYSGVFKEGYETDYRMIRKNNNSYAYGIVDNNVKVVALNNILF